MVAAQIANHDTFHIADQNQPKMLKQHHRIDATAAAAQQIA
jgi:hypothetical protein